MTTVTTTRTLVRECNFGHTPESCASMILRQNRVCFVVLAGAALSVRSYYKNLLVDRFDWDDWRSNCTPLFCKAAYLHTNSIPW